MKKRCIFCRKIENEHPLAGTKHFLVFLDENPVNACHVLILSKSHREDIFQLNRNEWNNLQRAVEKAKEAAEAIRRDHHEPLPQGYNLGVNCGKVAGQTIFHFHLHLIPRYKGDVENPRGGIRNFKKPLKEYK